MFKYIFSDLPDEKCLSNNNIKTFFVDVEYENGKEAGKPTVIISYGSKSARIVSSEIFKNKIEHKNDIIYTIIKFIIFNCEEQLPIIYLNNETILTRSKFLFEPKCSSNVCSFKKCKNQPILFMQDVNKLYCILHSKSRINSNNIKDCALYYPYIIFNDMYTSKINDEGLSFFNVKILRLPEVFKYRFNEDLNMFDLEKYMIGRSKDDSAFSDATYRWRNNWLVITTCIFKSSCDLRKISRKIKINKYKEALSFTLHPNESSILNADLEAYNQPSVIANNWMYNKNINQQIMLKNHHPHPMNIRPMNHKNNLKYNTTSTLSSLRKLLSYWQTFFVRDIYISNILPHEQQPLHKQSLSSPPSLMLKNISKNIYHDDFY